MSIERSAVPAIPDHSQLQSSIVRIYDIHGGVVGAGFLVDEQRILTCAHVLNMALKRRTYHAEHLQEEITLDFQPDYSSLITLQRNEPSWRRVRSSSSFLTCRVERTTSPCGRLVVML